MISVRSALLVLVIGFAACSDDAGGRDAALPDAIALPDAESSDRGVDSGVVNPDAAAMDAMVNLDAEPLDAIVNPDAEPMDALAADAVAADAVAEDAVAADAVAMDVVPADAVAPDAVAPDADPIDAGFPDAVALDALAPDADPADTGPAPDAGMTPLSFATNVYPIINANCSCHDFGSGGLTMNNVSNAYNELINVPTNACSGMDRVEPGDAAQSGLAAKIGPNHVALGCGGSRMPASGPPYLSASDIATIEQWINEGANP